MFPHIMGEMHTIMRRPILWPNPGPKPLVEFSPLKQARVSLRHQVLEIQ